MSLSWGDGSSDGRGWPGHQANHRGGRPFSFGIGHGHGAVGIDAEAIGIAKSGRQHVDFLAVGRDAQESLFRRRRIEIAGLIAFQSTNVIVAAGRRDIAIANAFVEIDLAVAVRVVQARDLIATQQHRLCRRSPPSPKPGAVPTRRAASWTFCSLSSSPLTRQTSPCMVHKSAEPSGRKSRPPKKRGALSRDCRKEREWCRAHMAIAAAARALHAQCLRPLRRRRRALAWPTDVCRRVPRDG